jgi:ATP-dependent RNA helicase SUPV3L1/SUV3
MDLFPYYWKHVNEMYPHLVCKGDLLKVSDLTEPSYWYMEAREIKRKIIYHCGPTNSGKTYSALLKFQSSKSGIYCGPLKLLANEVFSKTNNANTPCDLITGEERKFSISELEIANHVACTVEMTNLEKDYEVAVIDEIQMIKDPQRGWAWTRALLGLKAKEIHVCGDSSAIDLISDLSFLTNDELKIENYERLTTLKIEEKALESLKNVQPGDCFVCFNKKELFNIAKNLESLGHEVALIYGSMPPTVKLLQQKKFNDPSHPCKILVATDAIGMGLNLNISRIIFTSLVKQQQRSKGDEQPHINNSDEISTSQALQIAGRAGRYNTQFSRGLVTTLNSQDCKFVRHK